MNPATLIAIRGSLIVARALLRWGSRLGARLDAREGLSNADRKRIKADARVSDEQWEAAVENARLELRRDGR